MDIQEKQAKWNQERTLFEADFIHSHLLPFFNFNENTGDYEIKNEFSSDEDHKLAYETLNTGWAMWLRAKRDAKAQAVPEGFVLMPMKPTEKTINAMKRSRRQFSTYAAETMYEAIIDAQEQGHD